MLCHDWAELIYLVTLRLFVQSQVKTKYLQTYCHQSSGISGLIFVVIYAKTSQCLTTLVAGCLNSLILTPLRSY